MASTRIGRQPQGRFRRAAGTRGGRAHQLRGPMAHHLLLRPPLSEPAILSLALGRRPRETACRRARSRRASWATSATARTRPSPGSRAPSSARNRPPALRRSGPTPSRAIFSAPEGVHPDAVEDHLAAGRAHQAADGAQGGRLGPRRCCRFRGDDLAVADGQPRTPRSGLDASRRRRRRRASSSRRPWRAQAVAAGGDSGAGTGLPLWTDRSMPWRNRLAGGRGRR